VLEPAAPLGFGLQKVNFSQQLDSLCMGFIMPFPRKNARQLDEYGMKMAATGDTMRTLALALAVLCTPFACSFAQTKAPLPDKIVTAKTVFLMNETGQPPLGDAVYRQIKTWNRWKIATDRAQADLLLIVSNKGKTYFLSVSDPRTGEELWTVRTVSSHLRM